MAQTAAAPQKTTIIEMPDSEVVRKEDSVLIEQAKSLLITNAVEHEIGLEHLKRIALAEKRVKDLFEEPKKAAHAAHKAITTAEAKLLLPLAEARQIITGKALTFQAEERRKAEEAQRAAAEAARKAEEERQLADAIEAEASGDKAAAEQILAAPTSVPAVYVAPQVAKVAGVSSRVYFRCKVVSPIELVRYVAAHPEEIALVLPNESLLNKRAESMRDAFKLPGCELEKRDALAVKPL